MKASRTRMAAATSGVKDKVYKIFTESEWEAFQKTGLFSGSADDLRDGFIHLSTNEQLEGVIERFFSGKRPLYVAEFSDDDFLKTLSWEVSASNEVYPHLYRHKLLVGQVSSVFEHPMVSRGIQKPVS